MNNKRFVAKWNDLVELHKFEQQNLVKLSKLVKRSIGFFPIERQKVSSCLQVFCDETISIVKTHSRLTSGNSETVCVLEGFVKFWKIVNDHELFGDVKCNDSRLSVIRSAHDSYLQFLIYLGLMVKAISPNAHMASSGKLQRLTIDTSSNFFHSCFGLANLSKSWYVLLGQFTTDPLEREFSK